MSRPQLAIISFVNIILEGTHCLHIEKYVQKDIQAFTKMKKNWTM
jgi:hypothetical protein